MFCPNCEERMADGSICASCGHIDGDPHCCCGFCEERRKTERKLDREILDEQYPEFC